MPTWTVGLMLAGAIALVAWRARALTASGAAAAGAAGTIAMGAGWSWGSILIAYFVSSSLLSRFRVREKDARMRGRVDKHGARDGIQVLANGGVFTLMALCFWVQPQPLWQTLAAGALAASAADTWATEIGSLSSAAPRSVLGWRPVPVGTSGGVTALGLLAGLAGAGLVALVAWLVHWPAMAVAGAWLGGIVGCLLDSLLGAGVQARRWCASCRTHTEQALHVCGNATRVTGGVRWLNNDSVNAVSTVGGALFGAAGARYF